MSVQCLEEHAYNPYRKIIPLLIAGTPLSDFNTNHSFYLISYVCMSANWITIEDTAIKHDLYAYNI